MDEQRIKHLIEEYFDTQISKKQVSELETATSVDGLYTVGINKFKRSVKVPMSVLRNVIDSLTSTSTTDSLSANQGLILNTKKADKTWVESLLESYSPEDTTYTAGRGISIEDEVISTSFDINDYAKTTDLEVGDRHYIEEVRIASDVWEINHNLGKYPSVTVVNDFKREVVGDVEYIDKNNIKITFTSEFSGEVICN